MSSRCPLNSKRLGHHSRRIAIEPRFAWCSVARDQKGTPLAGGGDFDPVSDLGVFGTTIEAALDDVDGRLVEVVRPYRSGKGVSARDG